jgi:hypothetical protein
MTRSWGKHFWPLVHCATAIIALSMASAGCAKQLTIGAGCSTCGTPVAVKMPVPTIVTRGKFVAVGDMTTPRAGHIAVLLNDGRVLIAGGEAPTPVGTMGQLAQLRSAEIYDPAGREFTATDSMRSARLGLSAVLLRDGNVLFLGGPDAEIYNVNAGKFEPTGHPVDGVEGPAAVLLRDNNVLVCSGDVPCELYFPMLGKFRETSHLHGSGANNPILLPDGRVLLRVWTVANDNNVPYFELFDPETETFRLLSGLHASTSRPFRLGDGRIFLGNEFYHPDDDSFTDVTGFGPGNSVAMLQSGTLLIAGGAGSCAPLLPKGPILPAAIAGGAIGVCIPPPPTAQAWLYDPQTQTQIEIEDMNVARSGQTATTLKDGSVLIAGGRNRQVIESSAEIYVP